MAAQEQLDNVDKLGRVPQPARTDTSSGNTQAAALNKLESIVQTAVEALASKAYDTPIITNTKCVSFDGDISEVLGNNTSQESQNVTSALMAMTKMADSLKTVLDDSKITTSVQRMPKPKLFTFISETIN